MEKSIEKVFEIYTASGHRIVLSGTDIMTDCAAGDLTILNGDGIQVAQFQLMNIEGWRMMP